MRSKSKAIAGIALIMLASIMAGTTAVGATSEGPLSANDCPICPDSRMELYSRLCAWALVCGYRNSVDINNCGDIAIWTYDNARDAQKRFGDMRTSKEEWGDILRVDDDEIVVINQYDVSDPNYHYSVSGCFLRVCSVKSYITEVRVNTATKDKNTTIKWFEELAGCAKRVVGKKCGEKDDVPIIKPDNTSCKYFFVDQKDFDLAYDNEMLRKEFLDFLEDYGSTHVLKSASDKYDAEWFSSDFLMLEAFFFTDKIMEWRFLTGKEDNLGNRIDERFKKEGRPLKPAEVFEESLKINDNCVFDALLTAHNYLKKQCHDLRFTKRKDWKDNYDSVKKNIEKLEIKLEGKGVLDPFGQIIESPYLDKDAQETIKLLDTFKKQFEEMENVKKNAETPFKELKQLRSKRDNEGAWYHLFLTATMGYGERKYEWDCAWTKTIRNIFSEHLIYKGILERKWLKIDKVEFCWDVWGAYLGCEIYSTLLDNQEKVKEQIKEHPEVWVNGEWDPSYILDAYTGQKIDE